MAHYLLFYDLAPDYLDRRGQFRDEHLAQAWAAKDRGELLLGGALTEPTDTAVLLFQCDNPDVVRRFAEEDVYVKNGLVRAYRIRSWATVVVTEPTTPIHPAT
ncbi:MAG: YciI family protein [Ectothiorhodospiraceae bacterium]|nr:YciI family protein [Ectothiorhodospiraceae bacterium]